MSTLANTLTDPSKPETDDLAKILLLREEDSTRAMIPESVRVPVVGGNLKPDPLDMPRRRGREERKEIFKREVEITKRVLKKVNIEVSTTAVVPPVTLEFKVPKKSLAPHLIVKICTVVILLGVNPARCRTVVGTQTQEVRAGIT